MVDPELASPPLLLRSSRLPNWLGLDPHSNRLVQFLRRHRFSAATCLLAPLVLLTWTLGNARSPAQYPIDLIPTYVAGRLWLEGRPQAIYHGGAWMPTGGFDAAWLDAVERAHVGLPDTAFVYSPTYLALLLPLIAVTSAQQFFWCFAALNAACAVVVGRTCARLAGLPDGWPSLSVALLAASSFPASYAGLLGQNVLPTAALMLLGFDAVGRGRRWWLLPLLLASAFKPWAIGSLGVLLLGRKHRQFLLGLFAHALMFGVAPRLLFPDVLLAGYRAVLGDLSTTSVLAFNSIGLRALAERLASPDWTLNVAQWAKHGHASFAQLVIEALFAAACTLAISWIARNRRPDFTTLYTCCMALALGVLGTCWSHYLVFALPVVCRAAFRPTQPAARWLAVAAAFWMLALMSVAAPPLPWLRPERLWALVYSAPLLLSLAVAWLQLWGRGSATDTQPTPTIRQRAETAASRK